MIVEREYRLARESFRGITLHVGERAGSSLSHCWHVKTVMLCTVLVGCHLGLSKVGGLDSRDFVSLLVNVANENKRLTYSGEPGTRTGLPVVLLNNGAPKAQN